jgi:hypothetical protein
VDAAATEACVQSSVNLDHQGGLAAGYEMGRDAARFRASLRRLKRRVDAALLAGRSWSMKVSVLAAHWSAPDQG